MGAARQFSATSQIWGLEVQYGDAERLCGGFLQGWEQWLFVLAGVGVVLAVFEAQWSFFALLLKTPLGPHSH